MIKHSSMELKIKFNEMVTGGWESFSYKLKTENNSISLKTAKQSLLQGSVIIISSDCIHTKMEILDSQQYLWNLYLINNVDKTIVFLGLKVFISHNSCLFSL